MVLMKRIKQYSKELALDMFKWQIRFLPMPQKDREKHVAIHERALGLENKTEKKWK
jgi:hypothetical protein